MYLDSSVVECSCANRKTRGSIPGSGLYFSVTLVVFNVSYVIPPVVYPVMVRLFRILLQVKLPAGSQPIVMLFQLEISFSSSKPGDRRDLNIKMSTEPVNATAVR